MKRKLEFVIGAFRTALNAVIIPLYFVKILYNQALYQNPDGNGGVVVDYYNIIYEKVTRSDFEILFWLVFVVTIVSLVLSIISMVKNKRNLRIISWIFLLLSIVLFVLLFILALNLKYKY